LNTSTKKKRNSKRNIRHCIPNFSNNSPLKSNRRRRNTNVIEEMPTKLWETVNAQSKTVGKVTELRHRWHSTLNWNIKVTSKVLSFGALWRTHNKEITNKTVKTVTLSQRCIRIITK
jgi:hypothetical protein